MLKAPYTGAIDIAPLESTLEMPYTLTPGRAAGTVLAELGRRRLVGCRFRTSGKVCVPAQDFCPDTGDDTYEFVEAPATGTITGFTETSAGIVALIRIDGADFDFAHRIVGVASDQIKVGARVEAVWSAEIRQSMLAIEGFRLAPDSATGEIVPLVDSARPIETMDYSLTLKYRHAYGPYYGRLFDEIATNRRIYGVRTPDGEGVLVPPREFCDVSHKRTGTWAALPDTGVVRAMSIIYLEFKGQKHPPPYIYAEIILDGAVTRLIHNIAGVDMKRAKELVKPGTRVRAVWRDTRKGSLEDISHFEPIDETAT